MNVNEESKSDIENNRSKMNQSALSNSDVSKTIHLDKSSNPTLIDLMGDDMSNSAQSVKDIIYRGNLEEQIRRDRTQADKEMAEKKLKEDIILKSDGSQYRFFKSSIDSICDKEDIHLKDYMQFLKKFAFIMILLFCMYLTNFGSNVSGEYLLSNDEFTGFEELSIANINGFEAMSRFDIEKENGMDQVESSKFLTGAIDFFASLMLLGMITLRERMRIFASDYSVKLVNISKDYKGDIESEIKKIFDSKFGKVHAVAVIKDTGDILCNQIKMSKISRKVGDLKARNMILGVEESKKLTKFINMETKQKAKLERLIVSGGATSIKEVYVTFELPEHKKKCIEDSIEIGEFITKVRDPSKKKFIIHKNLQNPNQKIYENVNYPNAWKLIRLLVITIIFTSIGVTFVALIASGINSNYKYLKTHMECMSYDEEDYTASLLATSSETILTCVCHLKGDSVNSDAEMKKLCTKYQDTESDTIGLQVLMGIFLAVLNIAVKHGYNSLRDVYRFGSLRTRNAVLFMQIYLSIVIFNLVVPLCVFATQFDEPTRKYYIAISPMYSLWMIFTVGFLPVEKFTYWFWVWLRRKMKQKSCVLQKELEDNLRRKEFDYYHKIPYLMGLLTVVMYLVNGIPFLLLMFAIFVFLYFWIEKLLVLKFYRKPKNLDGTPFAMVDYMVILILIAHVFSCISTFGTADIFPESSKKVQGTRKGYYTSYYQVKEKGFFEKFGAVINIPYLIMLVSIIVFMTICYLCRNKIWWSKFRFFSMNFRYKYKYIPPSFTRTKNSAVIGEVSYNMADLEKYKEALATFDLSKINDEAFKSSYSQLFQTSNGPFDTLAKLNLHSSPDKTGDSFNKSNLSGLTAMNDPQKIVDNLKNKDLMIRKEKHIKNPKVQVVKDGKNFDRKKTFIKNWEFEEPNQKSANPEDSERLDEESWEEENKKNVDAKQNKPNGQEVKPAEDNPTMADKVQRIKKEFHVSAVLKKVEN
ncbi:unnamed protein product [Moneuplotes crassus]|uniref:Uncharacterized protein n=1 Tax=Euplotes crassus TaxID=5936 RepID=A0AAD1XYQ3_EUPCR|nr:unnamed protein product [Moneuplotes crassus]